MKKTNYSFTLAWLLLFCLAFLFLAPAALAQSSTTGYSTKRDNTTAKDSIVVFPGQSKNQIVLKSVDVTGDNADTVMKVFTGTLMTTVTTNAATSATVIGVGSTNGFAASDMLIIQRGTGTATLHSISSLGASSITVGAQIGTAAVVGDQVWYCGGMYTNSVGSATVRLQGDLQTAQTRAPLAVEVLTSAGSANRINNATVIYVKPYP